MKEPRAAVEVSCGMMVYGVSFKVRLNTNGKFEAFAGGLNREMPGKSFDDVEEAIDYGEKWRNHFAGSKDINPI